MSETHEDWQEIQPDESWPVMTGLARTGLGKTRAV